MFNKNKELSDKQVVKMSRKVKRLELKAIDANIFGSAKAAQRHKNRHERAKDEFLMIPTYRRRALGV